MRDLLVTGTDTEVGKTIVAAALLWAARAAGRPRLGFKPVETGLVPGQLADSELLAWADGQAVAQRAPLLRLAEPLTPALAAERAGQPFKASDVLARVHELRALGHALVIEGAGGLLAPLSWDWTALDLAAQARLDVVLVARAGLGTLNHVLLSATLLHARRVALRAVVLNGRAIPPDLAEATNPDVLARLLPDAPVIVVPRFRGADVFTAVQQAAPFVVALLDED